MKNLLIVWSDVNMTQIPIIDEQHRGIVSIINNLFYFMGKPRASELIDPTLIMLEKYTKVHFTTEESIMELVQYEKINEHQTLHEKLMKDLFSASVRSRWINDPGELLPFLKEWWLSHINGADHAYAPFVFGKLREMGKL